MGKQQANTTNRLLEEFPSQTFAEWKAAAEALLKGRSFEKTLLTPTCEGFSLQPIYMAEDAAGLPHLGDLPGFGSRVRGSRLDGYLTEGWKVSQELMAPTPKELNALLLHALQNGQNEANIWLDAPSRQGADPASAGPDGAGVCGVSLQTRADVAALFANVHMDAISLYLHAGMAAPEVYALVLGWLAETGQDSRQLSGCIGYDPLGWLSATGSLAGGMEAAMDRMADMLAAAVEKTPDMAVIEVNALAVHDAGGNCSQELATLLATAFCYLKAMVERGFDAATVAAHLRLRVAVGGNYFLEVAKLRALRLLWNRLLDVLGVTPECRKVHIHARTGLWNKTVFDPYVNMLRTTTEAFSAVVGGCDSLHVGPFDEVIRESDAFSQRIARNTHAILAEECDLARVIDPSGGSWAVESLTDQLAQTAWQLLQETESAGGYLAVLQSGSWQSAVEAVRVARAKNIQQRRDLIVGTNAYPNANEQMLPGRCIDYAYAAAARSTDWDAFRAGRNAAAVDAALARVSSEPTLANRIAAAMAGATLAELYAAGNAAASSVAIQPLLLKRAAADFEGLRSAALALRQAGKSPRILQINFGPSRRYRARADWTSAFFQVGGIEVLNTRDFNSVEEVLAALAADPLQVAILTSDDESYAAHAVELARAIRAAHPDLRLYLAGAAGEAEAEWRAAGIDDFVNLRVNNYNFNRTLLVALGAAL